MASKRMFAAKIISDDRFRLMSVDAQALYFTFGMEADDYGIVGSPVTLMRAIGVGTDAFTELMAHGFILGVDGCAVIRHWSVNNDLDPRRIRDTNYPDVLAKIEKGKDDVYYLAGDVSESLRADCAQNAENCAQNARTCHANDGEVRADCEKTAEDCDESARVCHAIGIDIDIDSSSPPIVPPTPSGAEGKSEPEILTPEEKERLLTMMDVTTLMTYIGKMWEFMDSKGKTYKNPAATIEKWFRQDHSQPKRGKRRRDDPSGGSFDTDEFFEAALARSYRGKNSTSV